MYRPSPLWLSKFSIGAACLLLASKAWTGVFTGSLSVFSVAVDSATDLMAAVLNYLALQWAARPADQDHPYGHGKAENLAGLGQSVFIAASCLLTFGFALYRLVVGTSQLSPHAAKLAIIMLAITLGISIITYTLLRWGAKVHQNLVLRADSLHYQNDILFNILAIVILATALGNQWAWLDPIGSILICGIIGWQAWGVLRVSVQGLMDYHLNESETEIVNQEVARVTPLGLLEVHALRSRRAGSQKFIDGHAVVCERLSLREAHELVELLQSRISKRYEGAEVIFHLDPCQDVEEGHNPCNFRESCPLRSLISIPQPSIKEPT